MKLTSMKIDQSRAEPCAPCAQPEAPIYPYGLKLTLDSAQLKKLGIEKLPELGKSFKLEAEVVVSERSEYESDHVESQTLGLQTTDMAINIPGPRAADVLYKKS